MAKIQELTLTAEQRRQLVATRNMLNQINDTHGRLSGALTAIVGIEILLEGACSHHPDSHQLRDVSTGDGWIVTCTACEASWFHSDPTARLDRLYPRDHPFNPYYVATAE